MNTKKVKQLRKEIGYHPGKDKPRKYLLEGKSQAVVNPQSKRALYLEMKKEL